MPTAVATRTAGTRPEDDGSRQRPSFGAAKSAPPTHRPDIDGLRAIAILLVVAFHAKVPGFSAGFIGVDVFFVLSGFLITRLIVTEIDATGSLRLGRFWIRRGRRLLPASALMVISVLAAGQWLDSPLRWKTGATESLAALTYWSNQLFAGRATDYFGEALHVSPLLHTWSLAVEEQFYLLWPLVFFLTTRFGGTGSRRAHARRTAVVVAITVASFALSSRLTSLESPQAFFAALCRAWEFGAGALLAVTAVHLARLGASTRAALGVAGVLLLGAGLAMIGPETAFPGTMALLPVTATMALIASRPTADRRLGLLLSARPLQSIGRLSYSWYLWHWPFVVFGTTALGNDGTFARLALSVVALVPAELTRRLVENPVRHSPRLARAPAASFALLATITLTATAAAGAGWWRADRVLQDPVLAALDRARFDRVPVSGACSVTDPAILLRECPGGGDPAGSGLVLVLGDSHGAHWIPAVDSAAQDLGLRMTASVYPNCPSIPVQWDLQTVGCTEHQTGLPALLTTLNPDVVVVSHSSGYLGALLDDRGHRFSGDRGVLAWQRAMTEFAGDLDRQGIALVVVLDIPRFDENPVECAARTRSPADCDASGAEMRERLRPFHEAERTALADVGHGVTYDPFPVLCAERCPVFIGDAVVYTDSHHLTATFSRTLSAEVAPVLRAAIEF